MTPAHSLGVVRCLVSEYMAHMPAHTDKNKGKSSACKLYNKFHHQNDEAKNTKRSHRWFHSVTDGHIDFFSSLSLP